MTVARLCSRGILLFDRRSNRLWKTSNGSTKPRRTRRSRRETNQLEPVQENSRHSGRGCFFNQMLVDRDLFMRFPNDTFIEGICLGFDRTSCSSFLFFLSALVGGAHLKPICAPCIYERTNNTTIISRAITREKETDLFSFVGPARI